MLFPLNGKSEKENLLFSVNTKNISSHALKISTISLVLGIRKITNIFNIFDEISFVFTSKKNKYPLIKASHYAVNNKTIGQVVILLSRKLFNL